MRWEQIEHLDLVTIDGHLLEGEPLIPGMSRTSLYAAARRGELGEPIHIGRRMYLSVPRLGRALGLIEGEEVDNEEGGSVVEFPRAANE